MRIMGWVTCSVFSAMISISAFATTVNLGIGQSTEVEAGDKVTVTCAAVVANKCECRATSDGYFDYYSDAYLDGQFIERIGFIYHDRTEALRACKEWTLTEILCK